MAAGVLRALVGAGHDVALVVSMPDRRRGRRSELTPTAVKQAAIELAIPVSERVADVASSDAELGVVVAFGRIIRPEVLEALDFVNLHFSLLPRWRGAAPVERAILAGDRETGVCLMKLEAGLDTGPVYATVATAIGEEETAEELRERLGGLGSKLLIERLRGGVASLGEPAPQVGEPTYADKLGPDDLVLRFERPAAELARVVRVGRASTSFRGRRLIVHRARPHPGADAAGPTGTLRGPFVATAAGELELLEVQAEGRARQPFAAWAAGARIMAGERLGDGPGS